LQVRVLERQVQVRLEHLEHLVQVQVLVQQQLVLLHSSSRSAGDMVACACTSRAFLCTCAAATAAIPRADDLRDGSAGAGAGAG
jgi:hypothetical protein